MWMVPMATRPLVWLGLVRRCVRTIVLIVRVVSVASRHRSNGRGQVVSAISRIADMSATDGLFTEGLVMAMIQQGDDVQERLGDFVNKKAHKVQLNA